MFFFFNDTATTEIYTLSLHDALPISITTEFPPTMAAPYRRGSGTSMSTAIVSGLVAQMRSEEHTSELQSRSDLVCRLLLEKKKKKKKKITDTETRQPVRELD